MRRYQRKEVGFSKAAAEAGVNKETFRSWVRRYEAEGVDAFLPQGQNCVYSEELKCAAVQAYLGGEGSQAAISQRYHLRSKTQLQYWLKEYNAHGDFKSYRRLNDDLRHDYHIHVNDKRVLRICRARDIRSTVKYNNHGYTRQAKNPQYIAENLIGRQFHADKSNEKWLTDVTEFKWYEGITIHKLYLSAILDLCDRRIFSYAISEHNDNSLVFKTFDKAVQASPGATPCSTVTEVTKIHRQDISPQACAGRDDPEYVSCGPLH